ncbi:DNA polymerase [Pectobacterium phage vB_PcaM_CBB]|uniref:DNA-directed DNA polymerase n=1 Tax=Pectobacterium phage vB_PcaM_CBB TaxID=2772511 RepID=A0A1L2CV02_9CAUD|nr:DNA polymerase [Pectobacterium phage vB_PcaM_CBB]AMM43827.1 DNA polymerase [Pectobacterium phage vB_PcaM_CBB]
MYVDGYMDRKKTGEVLHVAERVNGQRILREIEPVYEYYVESPRGEYKTINGTLAEKFEFTRFSEMKKQMDALPSTAKIYEADCNVTFKTLAKHYMGKPSPDLNIVFFDIETDFHPKFGYAQPSDPFNRVTAISLYQSWTGKDYVLTMAPSDMEIHEAQDIINRLNAETNDPNSVVILYTEETEMFQMFFELIEDGDVLSGWNSEFFDIPYMVNRTRKIFNEATLARWCLWNKKPNAREADMFGKTIVTYDLVGRVHLDYLALYKKHAGQVEQSYKLDYIAEKVTGENKVSYDGSLDKLYREDYETFLRYSKQDSILLKKIDEKMDFINLHNRLAHKECVLISTTMGSVALIDTAIINLAHQRGEVVFNKRKLEEDEVDFEYQDYESEFDDEDDEEMQAGSKAAGAWVQDPVLGLIDFLGCVDFNSLYPTVLRTLGMSTECILGQLRQTYTDKYLADKIEEQRVKWARNGGRGKFEPKWTEAWHGLFASVEFTMVREKSRDVITVDLEDGTTFEATGAELYDIIFGEDSTIVLSANGTLFDKTKYGVIPEILTMWYSERKAQQKMVIDYKHLATDGWEIPEEAVQAIEKELQSLSFGTGIYKTNLHEDDPIYLMRLALGKNDYTEMAKIIASNGMRVEDNHIFVAEADKKYCKTQSAFWKQNQQIRKILLNSLYGALLNKGSRFFDKRLGQSVTLTGRSMTKHLASKINEVCTETYDHSGGVVVYGDTDSVYFSVAHYYKENDIPFEMSKDEVVELYQMIGDTVGASFPEFMDTTFNTGIEKGKIVGADLEMVGSRGLFLKKKRYAILKYWEDGFRLDVDGKPGKIKAMGLEIKRSDTPKYIQNFLEETLVALLIGETEEELRARVRAFKKEFKDKPSIEKGSPKTVKNYTNKEKEYQDTGKCSVGHVLAAIQWNKLRDLNDDKSVPEATDGTKVIVCDLKPNPLGIKKIGYPIDCADYLPEWYLELPFDDDTMEKAVLTKKLGNIFGILDMDIGIDEKSTIELNTGFFEW